MPLYEYKCEKCGKRFDVLQKFSDEPVKVHEECGGAVERLVSPPAFHFKGTGWYVTDYAKSNGVSAPASDAGGKDSKSGESKSGEAKSGDSKSGDSKPTESKSSESKTETKSTPTPAESK